VKEIRELQDPPPMPRFKRRNWLDAIGPLPPHLLSYPTVPSIPHLGGRSNVSPPRYRQGSTIVEYEVQKLRHGLPERTKEPFALKVGADGEYSIPWKIHAENLPEPTGGELVLRVETEADDGPPITGLDELLPPEVDRRSS
jgi:hypothetical protein